MKQSAPTTRRVVVVTGASAGIGAALARVFAAHGHDLVLIARREGKLDALADEIAAQGRPRPLVLAIDLSQPDAASRIKAELAAHGLEPEYVVNNAGFGLVGEAAQLDHVEQLAMIDLNIRSLTELSLAFADTLARLRGGLLNVSSVAGFIPGPGMAVYYASKAYVLSFSEALHHELARRGVRVTALCPGPVPTEFQARAGIPRIPFPRTGMPRVVGSNALTCTAEEVAEAGYEGLMRGRRVVVPGLANKAVTTIARLLPRRLVLEAVAHSQLVRRRRTNRVLKKAVREAP
jgi:short-subunit dehydrogenase